jgi:chaperonin GroES
MNQSGLQPLKYKVLVRPIEVESKTAGGIYLPDSAKEKEQFAKAEGRVIAVGEIAFTDPDWLVKPKTGDLVLFDKYGGALVTGRDGERYRLINDEEIGAIIHE